MWATAGVVRFGKVAVHTKTLEVVWEMVANDPQIKLESAADFLSGCTAILVDMVYGQKCQFFLTTTGTFVTIMLHSPSLSSLSVLSSLFSHRLSIVFVLSIDPCLHARCTSLDSAPFSAGCPIVIIESRATQRTVVPLRVSYLQPTLYTHSCPLATLMLSVTPFTGNDFTFAVFHRISSIVSHMVQ